MNENEIRLPGTTAHEEGLSIAKYPENSVLVIKVPLVYNCKPSAFQDGFIILCKTEIGGDRYNALPSLNIIEIVISVEDVGDMSFLCLLVMTSITHISISDVEEWINWMDDSR